MRATGATVRLRAAGRSFLLAGSGCCAPCAAPTGNEASGGTMGLTKAIRRTSKRARRTLALTLALFTALSMLLAVPSFASHVGSVSGVFESDDGNLAVDHSPADGAVDWNSFTDSTVAEDFGFAQFSDRTGNPDDIFNGGTKQDDECPGVKDGSLGGGGGKFDLSRTYLAHKNISGDEFLFLSWIRVPQNSTTASSHVAYEFNKGLDGQCDNSNLLRRSEGDMLIVYDFEGGTAEPSLKLSRWILSGTCEVGNSSPPCWGNTQNLTDSGFADAEVNTQAVGPVLDEVADPDKTLGIVEFGEAGINLTDAGVFAAEQCEEFGSVTAVSRSSGNSGTAQMKDKVGPGDFTIANCGSVIVHKTDADTGDLVGGAIFSIAPADDPTDTTTMTEVAEGIFCTDDLFSGDYVVTEESPPPEYDPDPTSSTTVTVDADGTTCADATERTADVTFENERQRGSIVVHKVDESGALLEGAEFTITPGDVVMTEVDTGIFCSDGLLFGTYTVTETVVPPGYTGGDPIDVAVGAKSDCSDALTRDPPNAEFTNNPVPGTVNILKQDDVGNPLAGIGFTLYVDDNGDGERQAEETTVAAEEQLTGEDGTTTFTDVALGFYCAVETTPSADHQPADPQCFEVTLGDTAGEGVTINLTFVNERLHKVIVIVCHEGTDTLAESEVANGDSTLGTLAEGAENEDLLCSLDGFTGKPHGEKTLTVDVGSAAHGTP